MNPSLDPVFVAFWTTGSDVARDQVFFLEGTCFPAKKAPLELIPAERMRPWADLRPEGPHSRRLADLGFSGPESAQYLLAETRVPELFRDLEGRFVVLASGRETFLARFKRVLPDSAPPIVLDLEQLALFLHPRRMGRSFQGVWEVFLGTTPPAEPRSADIRRLCEALVGAHFKRPPSLRQLWARGLENIQDSLSGEESGGASWLELCERLLDQPNSYAGIPPGEEGLFDGELEDGCLREDFEDSPAEPQSNLQHIDPLFTKDYRANFSGHGPLDERKEKECELEPEDLQILESFFDRLPRHFAGGSEKDARPERPGQRALAHAVRTALEGGDFLLADAPTGTGKTLGYLAPLMLWAARHNIRTGVSTYTRALQEQAFFREIPRALELLKEAGLTDEQLPRVSMLKGRANYICGRAIRDAAPNSGSGSAVAHATWLRLALFYCEDSSADLDGFPMDPGIPLGNPAKVVRTARRTMGTVRSIPQCCVGRYAKRCAAGVRSLRAERSHLVVTNHAFVLARPEYFQHLVFDECDHLHQVATSALSFDIEFDEVVGLCDELTRSRGRDAAPMVRLGRLMSRLAPGDSTEALRSAVEKANKGLGLLEAAALECTRELRAYQDWRKKFGDELSSEERAFLLHDFLDTGKGDGLATALNKLKDAVDKLDSGLRECIEELGTVPSRSAPRLRWTFRKPLELLAHWREGLFLWLGGKSDDPAEGEDDVAGDFSDDFLYDAIFDGRRRRPLLSLKWLLPQKWLGETYLPTLQSAALVSATNRIRGGFKAMRGYLGLDILEEDLEVRKGRVVHNFAGPPTFDPRNALVCIPEDAPDYGYSGNRKAEWMDYVQDVLLYLGERASGRTLGLFTNRMVLQQVGERLEPELAARGIPLWWQGMPGLTKEEIAERFRSQKESVLLGLDTFWYGVDFPGETCEYVVMTKLPYGVLDDYHFAQTARLGYGRQRNRIYLPKALSMFRQGCGRLLRSESDTGGILILDRRVLDKRHAPFLKELPGGAEDWEEPNIMAASTDECFQKLFAHMHLGAELKRRGLQGVFSTFRGGLQAEA
ncbi:MAG: ATP-dependent DNA helicase [Planctomycetota bacterium]|jgi:Rad3-related DNA helicase|nr:ATP-dependent DNA helicase [Planctomycetota bacterium]